MKERLPLVKKQKGRQKSGCVDDDYWDKGLHSGGLLTVVVENGRLNTGKKAITSGFVREDEGLKMIAFFLCMADSSFCQDRVMVFLCLYECVWAREKSKKNGFWLFFSFSFFFLLKIPPPFVCVVQPSIYR
jgi:hypothetical protein